MEKVLANELKLGDVVRVFEGAFGTAVVTKVSDNSVTFFRPYGTTADFSCSAGVIPYIGTETFSVARNGAEYVVYQRKELA